jgi:hypothetical protein
MKTIEPIREWRLHLGAHKTATTHLQETLARRREWLLERDLDFLPMPAVRALRLPPPRGRYGWRLRLGWPMRHRIETAIASLRRGPGRIAISEENLLGGVRDLLGWPFYPDVPERLRPYATLAPAAELHVFLAVRGFDKLLPSAYTQQLRFRALPGGFDPIRAAVMKRSPSWTELVKRIRDALPRARLTVWRQEDYRVHDWAILSRFCGVDIPEGERLPRPVGTRSPSAQAVAAFEALDPGLNREARVRAAEAIVAADGGEARFEPFSESERRLLGEAYEEDLMRMQREFPYVLMTLPITNCDAQIPSTSANVAGKTAEEAAKPRSPDSGVHLPQQPYPLPAKADPERCSPEVSVLMSVYNGLPFLREALDDLLAQTFKNFELIVVDDGSRDGSRTVLAEYASRDPRVIKIENEENLGLPSALNRGMEVCRAPLIARADADDRYAPTRLEEQVAFMRKNPEIGLVSCYVVKIDTQGRPFLRATFPTRDGEIRLRELFVNCFTHPGVMFRTDLVRSLGGYDPSFRMGQDADLWNRLLQVSHAANMARFLIQYRTHKHSTVQSLKRKSGTADASTPVRHRALESYLGRSLAPEEARSAVMTFRAFAETERSEVLRGRAVLEEVLDVARHRETGPDFAFIRRAVSEAYLLLADQRARTQPSLSRSLALSALRLRPTLAANRRTGRMVLRALLPKRTADLLKSVASVIRRGGTFFMRKRDTRTW